MVYATYTSAYWDRSVVWGMLQNPAYMGRAAFGKTKTGELRPRVRPQKHSAETPKRPYSVERTNREDWIEIPVPAIVSEKLFLAVQHQLDENRKRARQRRRGAAYLLQGLAVCGHCHYAYYGKKVSNAACKGKKQYAYYRCVGTDGYRFGGQRICDNQQVENRLMSYNKTATDLNRIMVWWEALTVEEQANPKNVDKLVERTETVIHSEHAAWVQEMQDVIDDLSAQQDQDDGEKDKGKTGKEADEEVEDLLNLFEGGETEEQVEASPASPDDTGEAAETPSQTQSKNSSASRTKSAAAKEKEANS